MRLILASNSPRRKELLSQLNYEFDVIPSDCGEYTTAKLPVTAVKEIALRKALNVYRRYPDSCVIGSDTVVDLDGVILGKPKSRGDAFEMLSALSGVCVLYRDGMSLFCVTSHVRFKDLDEEQIRAYIDTGSPMDKAGAYGVQDSDFVADITGSYTNVMGLPCDETDCVLKQIYKR